MKAKASAGTEPRGASRRNFIQSLPLAAIGAASLAGQASAQGTSKKTVITSIQIPKDFDSSLAAPVKVGAFEGRGQSGADIFAGMCKDEGVAALFCAAGNYNIINGIAQIGIPAYGGRSEGSMAMAADGFSRVTGEVVACSGTEGAGFTHMIQAIYTASVASTPLLVLASNMSLAQEDTRSFIQQVDQQPITTGIKKYGKRIAMPSRIHEYGAYAFRALKSGVPGPVHLDFPTETASAMFKSASDLDMNYDKSKYRTESVAAPAGKDVARAIDMIARAERPLLVAGQGIFHRKGWDALMAVVGKHDIGVVTTGPMRGHFPDDHPLSLNLAPKALMSADLIIFVGQYWMPTPADYRVNPDAKAIRVHPVAEDLGRNWPLDLGIVSDAKLFLDELADRLPTKKREQWVNEIAAARKAEQDAIDQLYATGLKYTRATNRLHPTVIGREIGKFFFNGKIDPKQTVNIWGGFTSKGYIAPYLRANRPGQGVCSYYQSGTIGSEVNHAIGAAAAVKEGVTVQGPYKGAPVIVWASDASLGYAMADLDTAAKYRLPLIVLVYNNNSWGTWITAEGTPRAVQMYLFQENLRYDKVAEGLGCHGEYVETPEQLSAALARAYDIASRESRPVLINCQALKEFTSGRLYPPGAKIVSGPGISSFSH